MEISIGIASHSGQSNIMSFYVLNIILATS